MPPRRFNLSWVAVAIRVFGLGFGFYFSCPDVPRAGAATADYYVQSWQADEGLPGNQVNDLLQDRQGFLWLGTIGGLVRFDGVTFKTFTSPLIARVAARNIRALAQTADATLLMLPAMGGVVQLQDGRFQAHPLGAGLAGRQCQTLFVDPGGAVWLGLYGGQVRRWRDGKISDFAPPAGASTRSLVSFAADHAGGVWIACAGSLYCCRDDRLQEYFNDSADPTAITVVASGRAGGVWISKARQLLKWQAGQLSVISTNLPWEALGGVVLEMFEDSTGGLWIGTSAHGLFRYAEGKFVAEETSQSQITAIMEDREGDIWVAMAGGGVNRLRPKLFKLYNTTAGLPEEVSDAVCADARGGVWLANRRGGVVGIRDGGVSLPLLQAGGRKLRAYSICADDRGWVWASEDDLYRFPEDHPDQVQSVSNHLTGDLAGIHVLFKSRAGDLWIGMDTPVTNRVGCFRGGRPEDYFRLETYPGGRPRAITEDAGGRIWIGTEEGQLLQLADGKFTMFTQRDGLPDAPIRALYADPDGYVWIGTVGGGLILWRQGKFTVIPAAAGLPDDNLAELMEDEAGRMWCGTRGGIFHVARSDLLAYADGRHARVTAAAFGKNEGLADISCFGTSQPMAAKTPDGWLWFATRRGVLALDAAALHTNFRPPPVFIDELFVNDRPLTITAPLRVPPLCNKIEFGFSVLSYPAPDQVRLRYQLEGVDSDWVELVNQRRAVYSALRPGAYRLHLQACNNDGVWNEAGASLAFVVRPAWWQSWWFQGSLLTGLMVGSGLALQFWSQRRLKLKLERLEHQQALTKERSRIARDLHDDLGATVTQVGLMLEELRVTSLSPEDIRRQSSAISGRVLNLARDLDAVVWSVNPGNDSLGELFAYLGQYFLECFRRTTTRPRLEVMAAVPVAALAPEVRHHLFLVVKEAVNNVIKHAQAGEVTLSLKIVDLVLEIQITDDGRGFQTDDLVRSKRHGLPNMRARVEQLGGRFEVSSRPGRGTVIRVVILAWRDARAEPRPPH